jgi:hypothetical protein
MVVPNYTYLKLKMPGPKRTITVGSTYRHAYECDVECVEYAEAIAESEALIADLDCLSKDAPDAKRHTGNFEPAEAVKALFVSASGSFWPPKTAADCQTLNFSASFYKIRWVKNHPKST